MSNFAKIDKNNVVVQVLVTNNDSNGDGGYQWLINNLGGTWIKTSYNTYGGVHYDPETGEPSKNQSKALRKNFAGIGYTYDLNRDAFIPPAPFDSWLLNENTCLWQAPVPQPTDGKEHQWNETTMSWELVETEEN